MALLRCTFCILICCIAGVCAQECKPTSLTDSQRLKRDLFCNYEKTAIPMKADNTVTKVRLTFVLKEFDLFTYTNEIKIHFFAVMSWFDEALSWDRALYGEITRIIIDSNSIWMPEIAVLNSDKMKEGDVGISGALCALHSTGLVHCTVSSSFTAPCYIDVARWPFDSQSCDTLIKPWTKSAEDFEVYIWLPYGNNSMVGDDLFVPNREWDLKKAELNKTIKVWENVTYTYMGMSLDMKRHGNIYEASIVLPGFVIGLAVLVSFWLDSDIGTRFCLCSTTLVLDCLYLQHVGYTLYVNGANSPFIVLFYRDHMLISAASLLITLIVHWMHGTELEVPVLATTIAYPIYSSKPASWLLLVQPTEEGTEIKTQQWQSLAVLLDRLSFVAVSISYLTLYLICF